MRSRLAGGAQAGEDRPDDRVRPAHGAAAEQHAGQVVPAVQQLVQGQVQVPGTDPQRSTLVGVSAVGGVSANGWDCATGWRSAAGSKLCSLDNLSLSNGPPIITCATAALWRYATTRRLRMCGANENRSLSYIP